MGNDFSPLGNDLFGNPMVSISSDSSPLKSEFLFPPFSVLSARDGDWQDRKRAWLSLGIKSEVGRDENLLGFSEQAKQGGTGTSIFDPVLCEILYRWFSAKGHQIVDPFAGGSVRGVVSSYLGRKYWGSELRGEQVAANLEQAREICEEPLPVYVEGDSRNTLAKAPPADLIFSCPPYGNLEKYSDNPLDLSTLDFPDFVRSYNLIIGRACERLKDDRFACFIVGDYRDEKGLLRNFISITVEAFLKQGLGLYNSAILITSVGSAALRAAKIFNGGRKLCPTHQNILVFCKGNPKAAAKAVGG